MPAAQAKHWTGIWPAFPPASSNAFDDAARLEWHKRNARDHALTFAYGSQAPFLLAFAKRTSNEEGNITRNLYEERNGSLFLYEAWRSREDLEAHFQKPYIKDFETKVGALAERNDVRFGGFIPVPSAP